MHIDMEKGTNYVVELLNMQKYKDYFKTQSYDLLRQLSAVTRTDTDTSNC